MAKNIIFEDADRLSVVCTQPATPASGDPVLVGDLPGIAETDERTDGTTTVNFECVAEVSVKGVDAAADAAVAAGDVLYYVAADTPKISKKNTGVRFGVALEAVASGQTATIRVRVGY